MSPLSRERTQKKSSFFILILNSCLFPTHLHTLKSDCQGSLRIAYSLQSSKVSTISPRFTVPPSRNTEQCILQSGSRVKKEKWSPLCSSTLLRVYFLCISPISYGITSLLIMTRKIKRKNKTETHYTNFSKNKQKYYF